VFKEVQGREIRNVTSKEELRQELHGRKTYWRMMLTGVLSVSKVLATNLGDLRRFRQPQASERRYERPPRQYDLPAYIEGMTFCRSRERYLRPTRYCNPRAPEIVAMAHELGAYRVSNREFAEAAFEFVKEKTTLEIRPIVAAEQTLRLGTGTCFELITLFIALCRAAGIKARYKIFPSNMIDAWREATIDTDPLLKKWYDSLGYFLLEGEGEAYIDGEWVVAHVGPTAARQASAGIPITRFGEDSLGNWFSAPSELIMRVEALPFGLAGGTRLLHRISPASMERVNVSVLDQIEGGQRIIEEAGGLSAYDARAREARKETND
jgi:hypothetical protein